jgi:AraC-like DNA-binding protein
VERSTLEQYLKAPLGRWVSGECWLHCCTADPYLVGTILWGALDASSLEAVLECANAALDKMPDAHAVLLDGRRNRSVDAVCYAMTSDFVIRNRKRLGHRVTSLGGVRPPGLVGAIAEGFFRVVPPPYPVQLFTERGEALRWLGCEQHASSIDEIERIATSATPSASILADLHRALEDLLEDASLESAARKLGLSVRSLQRRLRSEGTTFQREVSVVRVRVAQRLMLDTDAPLSRIASDAGFASPATFSVVFRKLAGESPREWREKRRQTREPRDSWNDAEGS